METKLLPVGEVDAGNGTSSISAKRFSLQIHFGAIVVSGSSFELRTPISFRDDFLRFKLKERSYFQCLQWW